MAVAEMVRCPSCGATNRVDGAAVGRGLTPVCGRCKTPLAAGEAGTVRTVTDANFASEVERSPVPVLLDLWAPWCGPCRTIAPVVEEVARETAGRVRVAKLNVDENPATASRFRVGGIPTLLVLVGGREVDRLVEVQPKSEILRRVRQAGQVA